MKMILDPKSDKKAVFFDRSIINIFKQRVLAEACQKFKFFSDFWIQIHLCPYQFGTWNLFS